MKYQFGDEKFKQKSFAIIRRDLLNKSAKEGNINLINRVLKTSGGWVVRAKSKHRIN